MSVVIETTVGDFTVDLYIEERPHTCKNFLKLCKTKYYNFCLFHSIQHNFIAQTGDPTGSGKNGESVFSKIFGDERKFFEAEMMPKMKHSKAGLLSMVNCGDNMLGSQFFLTLSSELQSLDGEHCIFGEIAEGNEILLKLNEVICDDEHRPYQDIRITHTVILEDPFDDPPGLIVPIGSPEPSKEALMNSRIAADEDLDESKGLTPQELEELVRKREAQAQATILEIVGDLPDADMAPPENVLFVCKLNPVTSDDDLEIIFSRFGKVKGCEVIRDKVTGDSLQYAFVEFVEQKSCEDAYFKMDNVLIDDRRIHVDFSQSVSKMRWKGKGRGVEHFNEDKSSDNHKNRSRNNDERMLPPIEHRNRRVDDDRANGSRGDTKKDRSAPREQQSRKDSNRNNYHAGDDNSSSRRECQEDQVNYSNERSRGHPRNSKDDTNRGERRSVREERDKQHWHDDNPRREKDRTRDKHRDERVKEDKNETRDKHRDERVKEERNEKRGRPIHDERHGEERKGTKERSHREERIREDRNVVERYPREERHERSNRDERSGGGHLAWRGDERDEPRFRDADESHGKSRDNSHKKQKSLREARENNVSQEDVRLKDRGRKRPVEIEPEKKSVKVQSSKMEGKAKDGSKKKIAAKKRRSASSSSSSSDSSSSCSSSSSSSSSTDSSDAGKKKRKSKAKKEAVGKKIKMTGKTKSKLGKTKVKG